jgi:hypothetical protein
MFSQRLKLDQPRPHFAEIPYYLWGQINYDSEGDCKKPTDRQWSWMYLEHRETGEVINVKRDDNGWVIEGDRTATSRLTRFFVDRCGAAPDGDLDESAPDGDHAAGLARAARVAAEFAQPALAPFDSHFFWGSWKWIGWYATEFTWVGRWIMHSVVRTDPRAIPLCIDWLRQPPRFPEQADALCYAVQRLSGEPARNPSEWIRWYDGSWLSKGAKARFPSANLETWLAEIKRELAD